MGSFYISHGTCTRQNVDRPVSLDQNYETWAERIIEVWQDFFDHLAPFEVHLVQPEPPIPVTRGTVGTILIVQHPQHDFAAVLTSALFDDIRGARQIDIAHSLDIHVEFNILLRCAAAYDECREVERHGLQPCIVRAGRHHFPRDRPLRVHDGLGLVIEVPMVVNEQIWATHVAPRLRARDNPPAEEDPGADVMSFMARQLQPRFPLTISSSSSTEMSSESTSSLSQE